MISCENISLTMLVTMAFSISFDQMLAPDWMGQQKFSVAARLPAGTTKDQLPEMWQRLLNDRFKLATHRESKVVPKYDLMAAKGGPKFKEASQSPMPNDATSAEAPRPHGPPKLDSDGFPVLTRPGMIGMNGRIRLYQTKMSMGQLAKTLSGQLGRPVADNTGLKGEYEIRLSWVKDTASGTPSLQPSRDTPLPTAPAGSDGPPLLRAVQDQLGLRLEATRGAVEFLVVDHAESPSDN
jgi:uncharacterized protein (TIGR03435 family)